MNTIDAMTVDECRDELRWPGRVVERRQRKDEWTNPHNGNKEYGVVTDLYLDGVLYASDFSDYGSTIPATLDEASRLPDGWMPHSVVWLNGVKLWQASALSTKTWTDTTTTGTTELEARFRLRVAIERRE